MSLILPLSRFSIESSTNPSTRKHEVSSSKSPPEFLQTLLAMHQRMETSKSMAELETMSTTDLMEEFGMSNPENEQWVLEDSGFEKAARGIILDAVAQKGVFHPDQVKEAYEKLSLEVLAYYNDVGVAAKQHKLMEKCTEGLRKLRFTENQDSEVENRQENHDMEERTDHDEAGEEINKVLDNAAIRKLLGLE